MNKIKGLARFIIFGAVVCLVWIFFHFLSVKPDKNYPKPVEKSEYWLSGHKNDQGRQQWIEQMHSTGTGISWRAMNQEARMKKTEQRSRLIQTGDFLVLPGITGTWREVGSNNLSGRIHCSDLDTKSGAIYCGSSGGNIWLGSLKNKKWTSLNEQLRMPGISLVRVVTIGTKKRILVASEKYFYYSDDNGKNWKSSTGLSSPANWGLIKRGIMVNDSTNSIILIAMEYNYGASSCQMTVYRSQDKGVSFQAVKSFLVSSWWDMDQFDIWADRYGPGNAYLIENNNLYKLAGSSITKIKTIPLTKTGKMRLTGIHKAGVLTLYAMVYNTTQSYIYGSDNGGMNWSYRGTVKELPFMTNSFTCSSVNPKTVYFGGVDCYRSLNGGRSWKKINSWVDYYQKPKTKLHADIPGIDSFKNSQGKEIVLISTDAGTYLSTNALKSVKNLSLANQRVSQYYSTYTDRRNKYWLHAGSQDQGYQTAVKIKGTKPGKFKQEISGDYGYLVSGDNGKSLWMVYPGFAMYVPDTKKVNISNRWDFLCSGQFWMPPLMPDPKSPRKVYLGGGGFSGGAHLIQLTYQNNKITHKELNFDFAQGDESAISALAFSPINKDYWYVTTNSGKFYASKNGGKSWTLTREFAGPESQHFWCAHILPSPVQLGVVFTAGNGYLPGILSVYRSSNNGMTFSPLSTGLPKTRVHELAVTPTGNTIFAATDIGPYYYTSANGKWIDLARNSAPDQVYWSVDYIPEFKLARFGTYGRGIWEFRVQ